MKEFNRRFLVLIIMFSIIGMSCTRQKKMVFLQGAGMKDSTSQFTNQMAQYKIHSGDVLDIKIISLNKDITLLFNIDNETNLNNYNNEAALYYRGYTVNEKGIVIIPMIGEVVALGLTLEEMQATVQNKVNEMLKEAQVLVRFGGFKFTVIGEVNRPGMFYVYNNRLTLLEAIGQAGNITDVANRENILIVRPTQTGTTTFRINLLDKNILQDPNYFLTPNDVVYVEPLKTKNWRLNASNISIILSSITTAILVLNFINIRL
jgi:polysaccharide export outer membrane protein